MASNKDERNELVKLLEDQQKKLERYEKRLRDLVAAYKSLDIEKKALESSLKAINDVKQPSQHEKQVENADENNAEGENSAEKTGKNVEQQMETLSKAIVTLTNEKAKMESNFLADKKKLRSEKEELELKMVKEKQENERLRNSTVAEFAELKKKIWAQQMEREKEHSDHAVMLRELQTLVAIERSGKEQLELQLEDLQHNLDRRPDFQQKCSEYETTIKELRDRLSELTKQLKSSEERAEQPQPLLLKLQKELERVKTEHTRSLLQENRRANEAEEQLQSMADMSEERVANLELKLSELSETVGNYDRIRQQDQHAINSLKERVAQLERENSVLSGGMGEKKDVDEDSNLDVGTLASRILKIKSLLHAANQRSETPLDIKEFLNEQGLVDHSSCNEELRQLKEEFERYKTRAQSVLKNKNNKESCYSKEEETLKRQVSELKNKLKQIMNEMQAKETHYQQQSEDANALIVRIKQQQADEGARNQQEFRGKISEMENEMQKHRTRTLVLLEEKDKEIKRLKETLGFYDAGVEEKEADSDEAESGRETTTLPHLLLSGGNDGQLLHYVQEISRKDLEVGVLRRDKHQLETALREVQSCMAAKGERDANRIEKLRKEIDRLERNVSREGANLEYLKNVVLNYMLSSDVNSRHHMLNAIATLLKFSPKELTLVQQYNRAWWWQHAPKPNEKPVPL